MPDLDEAGCWRLAVAVLRQAVEDVADPRLPTADREQARAFLQGGGLMVFWIHLLGLSPHLVSRRYPLSHGQAKPMPAALPPKVKAAPTRAPRQGTGRPPDAATRIRRSILDDDPADYFINPYAPEPPSLLD